MAITYLNNQWTATKEFFGRNDVQATITVLAIGTIYGAMIGSGVAYYWGIVTVLSGMVYGALLGFQVALLALLCFPSIIAQVARPSNRPPRPPHPQPSPALTPQKIRDALFAMQRGESPAKYPLVRDFLYVNNSQSAEGQLRIYFRTLGHTLAQLQQRQRLFFDKFNHYKFVGSIAEFIAQAPQRGASPEEIFKFYEWLAEVLEDANFKDKKLWREFLTHLDGKEIPLSSGQGVHVLDTKFLLNRKQLPKPHVHIEKDDRKIFLISDNDIVAKAKCYTERGEKFLEIQVQLKSAGKAAFEKLLFAMVRDHFPEWDSLLEERPSEIIDGTLCKYKTSFVSPRTLSADEEAIEVNPISWPHFTEEGMDHEALSWLSAFFRRETVEFRYPLETNVFYRNLRSLKRFFGKTHDTDVWKAFEKFLEGAYIPVAGGEPHKVDLKTTVTPPSKIEWKKDFEIEDHEVVKAFFDKPQFRDHGHIAEVYKAMGRMSSVLDKEWIETMEKIDGRAVEVLEPQGQVTLETKKLLGRRELNLTFEETTSFDQIQKLQSVRWGDEDFEDTQCFVAKDGDEIVGYAIAMDGQIMDCRCIPTLAGRGIVEALSAHCDRAFD